MNDAETSVGLIASKDGDDLIIEVCGPEYGAYVVSSRTSSGAAQYFGVVSRSHALGFLAKCRDNLRRDGWNVLEFDDLSARPVQRRRRVRTL